MTVMLGKRRRQIMRDLQVTFPQGFTKIKRHRSEFPKLNFPGQACQRGQKLRRARSRELKFSQKIVFGLWFPLSVLFLHFSYMCWVFLSLLQTALNECHNPLDKIKSIFPHRQDKTQGNVFTGPRCLWGPVYGSRCTSVQELCETLLM